MNEREQKALVDEFIGYEKLRGIRQIKKISPSLKPLLKYLEREGLGLREVGVKQAQEFQTWLSALTRKNGSVHYAALSVAGIMGMARRLYDYLKHKGQAAANPFMHIKRMRLEKKLPYDIPVEQVLFRLLDELAGFAGKRTIREKKAYYRAHVMAELQYAAGMRIQEVLDMEEKDIDFEKKVILVRNGKGGKERIAYLNEYAAGALKLYVEEMKELVNKKKNNARLFAINHKATVCATYHRVLKEVGKICGLKRFTSHAFRHSLGFHLLRRGCDMRYIQLILGHENMKSTSIYTRVEKSDLKSVLDRCHPRRFRDSRHEEQRRAG